MRCPKFQACDEIPMLKHLEDAPATFSADAVSEFVILPEISRQ